MLRCVRTSCVCVYVEKFCVSKLYDDKLCVNSCG